MKDHLLWIIGVLALILAWFLCLRGPAPTPVAAAPAPAPIIAAPAPAPAPIAAPAPVPAVPGNAAFALQANGKVVVEGRVADDAAKSQLLDRAKAIYGNDRVIDKLTVDGALGALGALVLTGEMASDKAKSDAFENTKREVAALGANISVEDRMTVAVKTQQAKINDFLAGKIVLFETNSPLLTPVGRRVLDELTPIIQGEPTSKIELQGHTDSIGIPAMNQQLSEARAKVTMNYLVTKGVAPERLSARGYGQDKPVADNGTVDGRQRNRRIDFQVGGN